MSKNFTKPSSTYHLIKVLIKLDTKSMFHISFICNRVTIFLIKEPNFCKFWIKTFYIIYGNISFTQTGLNLKCCSSQLINLMINSLFYHSRIGSNIDIPNNSLSQHLSILPKPKNIFFLELKYINMLFLYTCFIKQLSSISSHISCIEFILELQISRSTLLSEPNTNWKN